jgi:uroporphyrin-III C-methyltransferase
MSDPSDPASPSAQAETADALARMAAYDRKREKKSGGGWGPLVLMLVVLVPLAAVGAVAWLQMDMRNQLVALSAANAELQQLNAGNSTELAQLQENQQQVSAALQETLEQRLQELTQQERQQQQQEQQQHQQELASANSALAAQARQISALERELADLRMNGADAGSSPLSEAETLLRIAQQRLVLAGDVAAAIDLYLAADELLRMVDDPQAIVVREALAVELAQLRALPTVDVPGLFAQLTAQAALVNELAVLSPSTQQDDSAASTEAPVAQNGWWNSVQQTIGEYFVVTRSTDAIMPQLGAEEQSMIRALVQLRIEQAKVALLRGEPEVYQAALDEALAASRQWLSGDENATTFLTTLDTLRNTPIANDIPQVDQALSAVRQLSDATSISPPMKPADPTPLPQATELAAPGTQL